ncbi:EAL domain-containing protein [Psychromonas sp. KJ10-10]|uniref:EAL domain-containing protein n=1 Tax=Psychromonas sp. KJ10-10 TaxID=3391823 RepID=UPI0039B45ACC
MYYAKKHKQNQFHLFNQKEFDQQQQKANLLIDIENDLKANNFVMYYQPRDNIITNEIVGFESLVRWNFQGKEVRTPHQFLPYIEHDHLLIKLGKKILNNVFIQVNAWLLSGFHWPVSINLVAPQLADASILKLISHLVEMHPKVVPYIHIEVTESTIFETSSMIIDAIDELQTHGFKIVLDDFGTGYSSIYSLKKLAFEVIKIDKCFIDDILTQNSDNLLILNTLIQLVQGLSLDIICEGVETQEQVDYLKHIGCDVVQGFYYHKPMPKHEVLQYIKLSRKLLP